MRAFVNKQDRVMVSLNLLAKNRQDKHPPPPTDSDVNEENESEHR